MDIDTFRNLSTVEVADLVRAAGPKVVVFPINGTRRWYMLEHAPSATADLTAAYRDFFEVMARSYVDIFQMLFAHGVDTVLSPLFGSSLLGRGEDYVQMAVEGLAWPATHPTFLAFYQAHAVRVRFYGDYRKLFSPTTPYATLPQMYDQVTLKTQAHRRHRLFYGLFANDATEAIAELAVRYHAEQGRVPDRRTLIELYYGEYVDPVAMFIGFDKFSAFDMPLVATGEEDLYFTVSPSPYFTEQQLRDILYDHLFARRREEPDDWTPMREFYRANIGQTLGVGAEHHGIWYPPNVSVPPAFRRDHKE
jgi:hypothetical protein